MHNNTYSNVKKNIMINTKEKRKNIPININSNPKPSQFTFSNPINVVASSYLSMGQKINILKNHKIQQKYLTQNQNNHQNSNNYITNNKDFKISTNSFANSLLNGTNLTMMNKTGYSNTTNENLYANTNVNSDNNSHNFNYQHYSINSVDKNFKNYIRINDSAYSHKNINSFCSLSNNYKSKISSNVPMIFNSFYTSNNNKNTSVKKTIDYSKAKKSYSNRYNCLDSKNKTKKIPMKSKIRQFKYVHLKNNSNNYEKPIISYFGNNNHLNNLLYYQNNSSYNTFNEKNDKASNDQNENKNYEKYIDLLRNKHNRNNTTSFDNKQINNIFNKNRTLSIINNYNLNDNNKKNNSKGITDDIDMLFVKARKKIGTCHAKNPQSKRLNINKNTKKHLFIKAKTEKINFTEISNNYSSNKTKQIPVPSNSKNITKHTTSNNISNNTGMLKQKNIKINLAKFLQEVKTKKNSNDNNNNDIIAANNSNGFKINNGIKILVKKRALKDKTDNCNNINEITTKKSIKKENKENKEKSQNIKVNKSFNYNNIYKKKNSMRMSNNLPTDNCQKENDTKNKNTKNHYLYKTNNCTNTSCLNNCGTINNYSIDGLIDLPEIIKKCADKSVEYTKENLDFEKSKKKLLEKITNSKKIGKLTNSYKKKNEKIENIIINKNIKIENDLFNENNLDELPDDYDDKFDDLYSIINRMNFKNVLVCVEGFFTVDGRAYSKYKSNFDKNFEKFFSKKIGSYNNSSNKVNICERGHISNAKTNYSSSKKNIINSNSLYNNDLNIVKDLNIKC